MSTKDKAISGLKWSYADSAVNQLIQFAVGIVLARLLSPKEYGIIGMMMVLIAISQSIVDSGLTQALIRKQNCQDKDYNTMFYSNIALGLLTFSIVFSGSGAISVFYKMPELRLLAKVMAINLVVNSFGLVETAILVKRIDFKQQTKISLIAGIISGVIGIALAYMGFGYWSLAIKTLIMNFIRVILLHYFSSWKPSIQFSIESFRDLFGFGIKIMAAGMIGTIYDNVYKLLIGKYFSAQDLGLYTRAEQFKNLPSRNLELTTQKVTYPILASLAGDDIKLKAGYKKLIKLSFFVTSTLMLFMMATSREVILITIGEKWIKAVPYLQIMCISGALFSLLSLNLNALKVKNRPDLLLKLEIIKKIVLIPIILVCIKFGVIALLWSMVLNTVLSYLLNSMWSAKLLNYPTKEQLIDILPTTVYSVIMVVLVYLVGFIVPENLFLSLGIKIIVALGFIIVSGQLMKRPEYMEVKSIFIDQVQHYWHTRGRY